jgi:hypothetical protein
MKTKSKKKLIMRGGARPGAGRKPMPGNRSFVTISLRKDTIELLRKLAGSHYIGMTLQEHLDRFPPKVWTDEYGRPIRPKRVILSPEEKEKRRIAKLSKAELSYEKTVVKLMKENQKKAAAKVAA